MPNTVGYLRVSTDNRAEHGFGLDAQRLRIEAYAQAMGWMINDWYVDNGYTGTTMDRPALQRLLVDCAAGQIERVIVYKLDRLSRKQRGILEIIEDHFEKNNVAFVSVTEQFDTSTPFGKAALGMLAVFAQLERDTIVERLRSGKKAKAAKGDRVVGDVPYGYRVVDGRTVVDPETAPIVRLIIARRNAGESFNSIAQLLNRKMIPTPKRGKKWYGSTVKTIVDNPIYRGIVQQTVGGMPSIVENPDLALL